MDSLTQPTVTSPRFVCLDEESLCKYFKDQVEIPEWKKRMTKSNYALPESPASLSKLSSINKHPKYAGPHRVKNEEALWEGKSTKKIRTENIEDLTSQREAQWAPPALQTCHKPPYGQVFQSSS